jgi:hypothetical protein
MQKCPSAERKADKLKLGEPWLWFRQAPLSPLWQVPFMLPQFNMIRIPNKAIKNFQIS